MNGLADLHYKVGAGQWSLVAVSGDLEITWHGIALQAAAEAIAQHFLANESELAKPPRLAQMQLELV